MAPDHHVAIVTVGLALAVDVQARIELAAHLRVDVAVGEVLVELRDRSRGNGVADENDARVGGARAGVDGEAGGVYLVDRSRKGGARKVGPAHVKGGVVLLGLGLGAIALAGGVRAVAILAGLGGLGCGLLLGQVLLLLGAHLLHLGGDARLLCGDGHKEKHKGAEDAQGTKRHLRHGKARGMGRPASSRGPWPFSKSR